MFAPLEKRVITQDEASAIDWQKITNQEGQFRGSDDLHALAQQVIALLEQPGSLGVAVLVYDRNSTASEAQGRLRGAVENLSKRKVQTRKIEQLDDNGHSNGAKLYIRYRE